MATAEGKPTELLVVQDYWDCSPVPRSRPGKHGTPAHWHGATTAHGMPAPLQASLSTIQPCVLAKASTWLFTGSKTHDL